MTSPKHDPDLTAQIAEMRAELRQVSKTNEKIATALERLAVLEESNKRRDNEIGSLKGKAEKHEARINALEQYLWKGLGVLSVLAVGVSPVLKKLGVL